MLWLARRVFVNCQNQLIQRSESWALEMPQWRQLGDFSQGHFLCLLVSMSFFLSVFLQYFPFKVEQPFCVLPLAFIIQGQQRKEREHTLWACSPHISLLPIVPSQNCAVTFFLSFLFFELSFPCRLFHNLSHSLALSFLSIPPSKFSPQQKSCPWFPKQNGWSTETQYYFL